MADSGTFRPMAFMAALNSSRSFRFLDDADVGGKQFDAILFEDAGLGDPDGGVEGGLAAQCRQDGVGALLLDDLDRPFPG